MDDIAELEEPEEAWAANSRLPPFALPSAAFEQQGMDKPLLGPSCPSSAGSAFPRPQVKLFGKEKLEVPLPPLPGHPSAPGGCR